eukprot:3899842-Rhodomonas_salina.2
MRGRGGAGRSGGRATAVTDGGACCPTDMHPQPCDPEFCLGEPAQEAGVEVFQPPQCRVSGP